MCWGGTKRHWRRRAGRGIDRLLWFAGPDAVTLYDTDGARQFTLAEFMTQPVETVQ